MRKTITLLIIVLLSCTMLTGCNVWPTEPERTPVPWPKELLPEDLPEMRGDVMVHGDNPDNIYLHIRTDKAGLDDYLAQLAELGYTVDDTKTSPTAQLGDIHIEFQWQGKKDIGMFLVRSEPEAESVTSELLPNPTQTPVQDSSPAASATPSEQTVDEPSQTSIPGLHVEDIYIEGWIMDDETPLKNVQGETVQTLKKADIVVIEEIDGETYWVEYGGEFLQVSAADVSVSYGTTYLGEVLRETYGYSFELEEEQYRVAAYSKGDEISVVGRSGNFYHVEMDDGSQVNVPAHDLSVSRN